jgi:hypothetical protein
MAGAEATWMHWGSRTTAGASEISGSCTVEAPSWQICCCSMLLSG